MNRQDLEHRLSSDAQRLRVSCPPRVVSRVAARVHERARRPRRGRIALPVLAGAMAGLALLAVTWMHWQPSGVEDLEDPSQVAAGLNAGLAIAMSDHLAASRETALVQEWRLLERDLRHLRDHVTAPFEPNTDGQ